MRRWTRVLGVLAAVVTTAATLAATPGSAAAAKDVPVRVLTWNILHGGQNPDNLRNLLEQIQSERPDVFLTVETYGSGPKIEKALDAMGKGDYTGVRITDRPSGSDNLWLFTRYPVLQRLPKPTGDTVSDFNIGGARVQLPNGPSVNLFTVWVSYSDPWNGYLMDENAAAIRAGRTPPHAPEAISRAETVQNRQLGDIIRTQLPAMLNGNTDPVVMGGDLNTPAASDWTPSWGKCPGHLDMSYPLTATNIVTGAGFVDAFRAANPDACTTPGITWSPLPDQRMITPQRIDFTFAKGAEVQRSRVLDQRLPQHGPGVFYSDHAAIVSDLVFRAR
ncbi:endonuclease/exonuclease/phosphatase (EEP) superfamily protein YafD [Herbihabitans rhizosphaerae]|uniref:Endonuclease/exonuclease/phosphatase (EEP) superfamily protein YafD n=1 Tax=Herbihabitans rhizosphaerae TaxID=1872711 RepID=A0A4Q7KIH5_9PSEU|nr:endonuclease/exonuclease/phosphatase family protein [Herbihabitans rhizosphaerae]RZS36339.1 endonuclease/exonuclease/phosphatase (EEP) superfamily protein YafD [Herbihabitans rhizosphaerae]